MKENGIFLLQICHIYFYLDKEKANWEFEKLGKSNDVRPGIGIIE